MRMVGRRVSAAALCATLVACGSGMTSAAIRGPEYATWSKTSWSCAWPLPALLAKEPREPHVVVGSIEVRTSRVKNAADLRAELLRRGQELDADALVPPSKPAATVHSALNPVQPYYVHDDGRTQILEAAAIRFPLTAEGCRRGSQQR